VGEKKINEDIVGYLSIEDASKFLGNTPIETIKQKVQLGLLKAYKPAKRLLFDPKDLREFVQRARK
jgi:hypothetical protein